MAQLDLPDELDVDDCSELDDSGDRRSYRAHHEHMLALPQTDADGVCIGMYDVMSQSRSEYVVDLKGGSCTCADWTHNRPDGGCKHIRRVRTEVERDSLPAPDEQSDTFFDDLTDRRERYVRHIEDLLDEFILYQEFVRQMNSATE